MEQHLQVAVGILHSDGKVLIQQRQKGTDCAGQWEFPGGKLERDETPEVALVREFSEELNISISQPAFLVLHHHHYDHAKVTLHTFLIKTWQGTATGYEGQKLAWVLPQEALEFDLLAGAYPLLDAVKLALASDKYC